MGLYVRVYKNIKKIKDCDEADFRAFVDHPSWKFKIKNLEEDGCYVGEQAQPTISYPYSAHSFFRETLIKLIEREDLLDNAGNIDYERLPEDIPFYDFINFSDCEGCLDWEVSAKIFEDFEKYNKKAMEKLTGFSNQRYQEWYEIFKSAKDNGVVVFG